MAIKQISEKLFEIEKTEEFLYLLKDENTKHPDKRFIYRGLKDSNYSLDSSATRRFKYSGHTLVSRDDMLEYHLDLLENAKILGFNYKDSHVISDIELIADLQHHECATMLFDFTKDPLIALYFATIKPNTNKNTDCAVIILEANDTSKFKRLNYTSIQDSLCLQKIIKDEEYLYYWEPTCLNKRISAQNSVFILGASTILDDFVYKRIIIKESSKDQIQNDLRNVFGINNLKLFNDLPGFSYSNSQNEHMYIGTPEYLLEKAQQYYQHNDYKNAIKYYSRYININNKSPEAYYERGNSYIMLNFNEEAINDFNKLESFGIFIEDAYYNRGLAYKNLNDNEKARVDFKKALYLKPDHTLAQIAFVSNNVMIWLDNKDDIIFQETKELLKMMIENNPRNSQAYYYLGLLEKEKGHFDDALVYFTQSIENDSEDLLSYIQRSIAYNKNNRFVEALADVEKAISFDNHFSHSYLCRSDLYLQMDKPYLALLDCNKVIEIDPSEPIAYLNASIAYSIINKPAEAKHNYHLGIEIAEQKKDNHAIREFGKAFDEFGNLKENWKDA